MDLTVITVTYQSRAYIDACILSVVDTTLTCSYEHIVVDNGSTDGTVELIENGYLNFVKLIKNRENVGFSAANNRALQEAQGRYILFLNPDMQICQGTLDTLIDAMDSEPKMGMTSCKLLSSWGCSLPALQPVRFPKPFSFLPFFLNLKPFSEVIKSLSYDFFQENQHQEVDQPRGAFLLIRKEILDRLGFAFDPRYFILFEDVDLCREVKKLGYKIVYNPSVSCLDYLGRSFLKQPEPWKYLQIGKSFKSYVRKWHSPLHLIWLSVVVPLGFFLKYGLKLFKF